MVKNCFNLHGAVPIEFNVWFSSIDFGHSKFDACISPVTLEGPSSTWATLERVQWLADNECEFTFDVKAEIAKRRPAAPKWKPEYAEHAVDSREMRGGFVGTNTEYDALLCEPIESVLSKALELSGRTESNTLEERDPFAGLCAEHPVRAYYALTHAARRDDYPEWAWKAFLVSSGREKDEPTFSAKIAERLCCFPDEALSKLLYPSTEWLQRVSKLLSKKHPVSFDKATSKLIEVLHLEPPEGLSAASGRSRGRDWVTEALNSPVGHIARAILEDSRVEVIDSYVDPSANWLGQLARLLALSGSSRRHAIAIMAHHLGWFHRFIPEWTKCHLLSILDANDDEDREALWAGFFWNPRITSAEFYMRLKPALLALATQKDSSREGHIQSLASLTLLGWISPGAETDERWMSNAEFRDARLHGGDDFRSHVLWQIGGGLKDGENNKRREWLAQTLEFLHDVWPRQKTVKNPAMSIRLCELLLSNAESFPKLADVVLPFLTKIDPGHGLYVRDEVDDIIDKHPALFLKLLHTVLSDDVTDWPNCSRWLYGKPFGVPAM